MLVRCHRSKLSVWAVLCVLVLCWLYIFPVYRLRSDKEIVDEVLRQGQVWQRNQTDIDLFRKLLSECCDPRRMFAVTKQNSPMGKVLWYDGEFYHSHTVNNETYSLFVQETPLQRPLKKCSVVGNGGVLKHSGCGKDIDQADFVMRCNLPPLSREYVEDVGTRTNLVTANPSIIEKRFQNLLWSRKSFVESMKAYGSSYIYMPAFSMKPGTDPSLRAHYALADTSSNLTMLFANPEFLRTVGKFWKGRGVHAKRLSTGLFLVSLALGLCEEVTAYGFWPFSVGLDEQPVSHHYYDNVLPFSGFHAMPEEFVQLWQLHKSGTLRMRVGHCPPREGAI
ncbi:alpha-N-acetylneuraminide alpha-2,8-sialyltransferase [Oncorhynchus tshawytscha]|uniref:Alpha-N-acetylneuraminide alpha-2,8-sialyltransferase n=2 Tax=Oncorhynchus TaxID=8016 RepID=A0A8C7QVY9_ONCMY|nr:alpha-N-acetylneuraminide alpha-2,8-sialyltransferase [Oncorhynchus keta]XP_036800941.1 alpha-N-acetylneuraminide alpha-2,8-sialyltransferase [Oncorhynchus mykiss]XP_036800942.1 alpha-N-acetylneuraminide alpha-2,8-sialyltransferase [Oncorhynchus mykiss]XP_036800943.1 alpha-N-acetylneuraminide alpha-2,8-sialyltransferase [Oncorhynchus mykiss]XP_036800945.1 alpha-N-acetylneuraminide alpha-2,8-sialyltransferase [Oncorhynchus mykiss]XP_036800946.1 alpha-N-acetylneuraminide alpha-2,8-sialyltrans